MNKSSQKSPNPAGGKLTGILGSIAILLVIFVSGVSSQTAGGQEPKASPTPSSATAAAPGDASTAWSTRTLTDITIDAPFAFKPDPDLGSGISPEVRKATEYYESFDNSAAGNLRVAVHRISYKKGIKISLEGAMNGAMNAMIKSLTDLSGVQQAPLFLSNAITTDGLAGRRANYTANVQGASIHVDAVFIQSGQKIWMVQALAVGDTFVSDTKRMLDSVHIIKPAK